ncbi:hypothetical protein BH09PLA1_BH09PLA1_00620 [soil metagenome]
MNAKRAILRIQLDRAGKQGLERLCKQRGMTQIAVMSKLVNWFVRQDEVIQVSVLGLVSQDLAGPLARKMLEQISAKTDRKR